jgi:drug/metabolite transporter (DMT)-like permease
MLLVKSARLPVALLVGVTAIWGSTFVIVKSALTHMAPLDFLAWRFGIATVVLVVLSPRRAVSISARGAARGALIGVALGAGYIAQTYGLEHTTAAISGFLTGMFVVFTPLISAVVLRRRLAWSTWLATALAAAGLAVISLTALGFGEGELLTVLCAFFFALQIVGLAEWSEDHDPYPLAVVQLATTAVMSIVASTASSGLAPPDRASIWAAVAVTAVLATALAFVVQTWAQSRLSPARAAIVLTMEPVFAGVAAAIAGEPIGWRVILGGAMVLVAMYLVELSPSRQLPAPVPADRERSAKASG